jgi:ABC-type antimicrobial peptide transport system permease subunit
MHKKKTMYYLQKYMLTIIGIIIGAAGGYAYYYFVGCASGTCSITSSPVNSTYTVHSWVVCC